jgi:hypothetical protein
MPATLVTFTLRQPLAMFTIYIDDSGSAPEHKVVVASGILFPAKQLGRFEREWNGFLVKESIPDFHTSECLARNPHSVFAGWDEARVDLVFERVRQITFKFSIKSFCIAIYKPLYDEVMPPDMRERAGSYYTWALSSVLGLAYDWATKRSVPMEYVFDLAEKKVKREIEDAMQYSDGFYPGHFLGHYSFRERKKVPGLQATDLFRGLVFRPDAAQDKITRFIRSHRKAGKLTAMRMKESGAPFSL